MNIKEEFTRIKNTPSDINQHLQTLKDYASQVENVTEMGSRFGDSTIAFIASNIEYGLPKNIVSYDLKRQNEITSLEKNSCFKFIEQDTLKCEIEDTDLLFIDTLHRYYQLFNELCKHSKHVKRYIIMHDTTTYGETDEPLYSPNSLVKMSDDIKQTEKQGLKLAIKDFLQTEDGKNWKEKIVYNHNNGLTILIRTN